MGRMKTDGETILHEELLKEQIISLEEKNDKG
jgi:hypothetical protein